MYSQNHGIPCPVTSTTSEGSSSTNPTRMPYFSSRRPRSPGSFFRFHPLGRGILCSRSCTSPNGQSQPQTKRPSAAPNRNRNPTTYRQMR